ncbi:MAG TPA: MATE family efflux transporter [Thiolinea sp.]|nr:MATE family efflux transporter [Thiolinea sp.]
MTSPPFLWRSELRQLLMIALPIIAAQLLQVGMGVVDTLMAGRISALTLAAIALGSSIWHFAMLCGVGMLLALPPVISQHIGASQPHLIREELRQGIWVALIMGGLLVMLMLLTALLLPWSGIEAGLIPEVRHYLYGICWSLPFSCLYLVPRAFNDAMGNTMPMLWVQLALLPLNILGNYLFMFGHGGFPAMGAAGAALATGLSQSIGFVVLTLWTLHMPRYRDYDLARRMTAPDWPHIRAIVTLGTPIMLGIAMEVGMFTTMAMLMGHFGVDVTAGHQIALNISSLTFMVPLGIAMALTVRVGRAIGAGERYQAYRRGQLGIITCVGFMMVSALLLWNGRSVLAGLYTPNPQVVLLAAHFLMFAAIFQIFDGLQVSAMGALRGYKDTRIPMLMTVFCYWVIGIGCGLWLGLRGGMGPDGLWVGLVLGLCSAGVSLGLRFAILGQRRTHTPPAFDASPRKEPGQNGGV